MIASRERLYGEGSFELLKPTQVVAQVLRLQNQPNECQAIIDQCLEIIATLLGEETQSTSQAKTEEIKEDVEKSHREPRDAIRNPNQRLIVYQTRVELYYMQQRMEAGSNLFREAL